VPSIAQRFLVKKYENKQSKANSKKKDFPLVGKQANNLAERKNQAIAKQQKKIHLYGYGSYCT
jgi:hypothetical protein